MILNKSGKHASIALTNAPMSVSTREDGMSLQSFLAGRLKISKRLAKRRLDQRKVWVNRQCVWMAHHRLRKGDQVLLNDAPRPAPAETIPTPLQILMRDPHYVCVYKPPGLLSAGRDSIESRLRKQLGIPTLKAIHRLDRETSGCLLAACSPQAFEAAVAVFKMRQVKKHYQALVQGSYAATASTVKTPLEGERAISHVRCLRRNADASLLAIRIETGRTHQIRRHLALMRHPVLGDRLYGFKRLSDPRMRSVPRIMLHAWKIEMPHPMKTEAALHAHAPLPADFRHCMRIFGFSRAS